MRELVYYIATSLDGYIAGPDGSFDAFLMEGDHMEELIRRYSDTIPTHVAERFGIEPAGDVFSTVVMGWNTYAVGLQEGITSPYRHLEQVVFSRGHEGEGEGLTVTDEPPADVVRRLKREEGAGIWLCGGGNLATQLIDEIDRLVLKCNPVLFGAGTPLFDRGRYAPGLFDLVRSTAFESGVVVSEYARRA